MCPGLEVLPKKDSHQKQYDGEFSKHQLRSEKGLADPTGEEIPATIVVQSYAHLTTGSPNLAGTERGPPN
jgi:hypothetical protein